MTLVCDCGYRLDISADERERLAKTGERLACPQCGKSRKLRPLTSPLENVVRSTTSKVDDNSRQLNETRANESETSKADKTRARPIEISWFWMTMGIGMPVIIAIAFAIAEYTTRQPAAIKRPKATLSVSNELAAKEATPKKDAGVPPKPGNLQDEAAIALAPFPAAKVPIEKCVTLRGHTAEVTSAVFNPDGSQIASASWDGTVKLWNVANGQETATLRGHAARVDHVAFSPDGALIASADDEGAVKLWNAVTGQETAILEGHTKTVTSIAFSPDGMWLASASFDETVKLWNPKTGIETATLKGHTDEVRDFAFNSDGTRIASASRDENVKLWEVATGRETATLKGHGDVATSVVFSPDGKRIASTSWDHTVKLWDGNNGRAIATLKGHTDGVEHVVFSPDGARIASASEDGTVKLWDAVAGREIAALIGHKSDVTSIAFSPNGTRIASASLDDTVKLWDAATGQETATLKGHTSLVFHAVFSPDGTRIASASGDKTVKLWDVRPEALALVQRQAANVPREPEPPSVIQRAESVTKRPGAKTHGSGLKTAALLDVMNFNPLANRQYHHRFVHKLRDEDVNIYQDSHSDLLLAVFGPENDLKIVRLMINETSFHGEENGGVTGDGAAALGRCVQRMVGAVDPVLVRDLYQWMNANMARALLTKEGVSTVAGGVGAKFHMTEFGGKRMVCFTVLLDPR